MCLGTSGTEKSGKPHFCKVPSKPANNSRRCKQRGAKRFRVAEGCNRLVRALGELGEWGEKGFPRPLASAPRDLARLNGLSADFDALIKEARSIKAAV